MGNIQRWLHNCSINYARPVYSHLSSPDAHYVTLETLDTGKDTMLPPSTLTLTIWVPFTARVKSVSKNYSLSLRTITYIGHAASGLNGPILYGAINVPIEHSSAILLVCKSLVSPRYYRRHCFGYIREKRSLRTTAAQNRSLSEGYVLSCFSSGASWKVMIDNPILSLPFNGHIRWITRVRSPKPNLPCVFHFITFHLLHQHFFNKISPRSDPPDHDLLLHSWSTHVDWILWPSSP